MPLTAFQRALLATLATAPTDERYLAGGAALHFAPTSTRYSDDLDFFHDSDVRVANTFARDRETLEQHGYDILVELSQPGFIRAIVRRADDATRVDWAHDSAWRFMPLVRDPLGGLLLHPVDLAINKLLALAGRDEARDFVDILHVHAHVLPLGALLWAAVGKDPGLTPMSLLELLKRRGRYRPEDVARLQLTVPFDLVAAKAVWLTAMGEADAFIRARPPEELGCLYYATASGQFVMPATGESLEARRIVMHYGSPGGVLPYLPDAEVDAG